MTRLLPLGFRSRLFLGAILPALMMVSLLEWVFISRYQVDIERAFLDRGRAIASFGVAGFKPESPTLDSLLGRADAALYRAKDSGRNRVEVG